MNVYLAKFTLEGRVAYKIGYTKYTYQPIKRFEDGQYLVFDNIEILDGIKVERPSYYEAKRAAYDIEKEIQAVWPKNFFLEEHFDKPRGTFNGLSGITEMFILVGDTTEQDLKVSFQSFKDQYT
jgi:hypothetical protein